MRNNASDSSTSHGLPGFQRLPIPTALQVREALAAIGVTTTHSLTLLADFDLRIIIPVIEIPYPKGSACRRVAVLLANDGRPVARDLVNAVDWLRRGQIPTRAEAYRCARMARKPLGLPLRCLEQQDRLLAICIASASPHCREQGVLGVCRARQVLRQGRAFLDDAGTLQWICGACAQSKGPLPWASLHSGAARARDPLGLEWGQAAEPPVIVTLPPTPPPSSSSPMNPIRGGVFPTRKKGQARWDEQAFARPWSPSLAYAMGVIAGDGAVHPGRIVVELAMKDRDILEAVCLALGVDPSCIRHVRRKAQKAPTLKVDLSSPVAPAHLIARLGLAGFGPKHDVLVIPPDLPDRALGDFVRGFLDTDGSVHKSVDRSPAIQFHSNSRAFLDQLRARIGPLVGSPMLGALHRPSGRDAKGRPRKGWALVVTGYEAQDVTRWLWPAKRPWVGGMRKFKLAQRLILRWKPVVARKAKRRNLGPFDPPEAVA